MSPTVSQQDDASASIRSTSYAPYYNIPSPPETFLAFIGYIITHFEAAFESVLLLKQMVFQTLNIRQMPQLFHIMYPDQPEVYPQWYFYAQWAS